MSGWTRASLILVPLFTFIIAYNLLTSGGEREDGRVQVDYWEVWSGFEREAMQTLVDEFNASQDRIYVNFLSVSQMDRKLMLATAGGNPPDIAGINSAQVALFAENGALTPLKAYAAQYGVDEADYLPAVWALLTMHDILWALPTTPGNTALHWNKKLFREAGLDPDTPPRTIAELEAMNDQITRYDERGYIEVMGHLPQEPGWWMDAFGYWFGGTYWNGEDQITADSPGNIVSMEWVSTYPERFGHRQITAFQEMSGNFASPENPFFNGRVAMVLQGPWMYNFITNFAPEDFEWGVAPFPAADLEDYGLNVTESNMLVIPNGADHPDEAFEFIAWLQQPEHLEKLNLLQRKFSPLAETSDEFYAQHPNPLIKVYADMAANDLAMARPQLTIMQEYQADLRNAYDAVTRGDQTPAEALTKVQERQQQLFDRMHRRWKKVESARLAEWREAMEEQSK